MGASGTDSGGSMASGGGGTASLAGSAGSVDSATGGGSGAGVAGAGVGVAGGSPTGGPGGEGFGGRAPAGAGGGDLGAAGVAGGAGEGTDSGPSPCAPLLDVGECGELVWEETCQDCEATGVVRVVCAGAFPDKTQTPCAPHRCTDEAVPGADVDCAPGQICVLHRRANGEVLSMECLDNPCASSFVDRDCAEASMCPDDHLWHVGTDDGGVAVDCYAWPPDCPDSAPEAGQPCPMEDQRCIYQDCEADGIVDARCVEGAWTGSSVACQVPRCGTAEAPCEVGGVCRGLLVGMQGGVGCDPAPEPGLVAQAGAGLLCGTGSESVTTSRGFLEINCTCGNWTCT